MLWDKRAFPQWRVAGAIRTRNIWKHFPTPTAIPFALQTSETDQNCYPSQSTVWTHSAWSLMSRLESCHVISLLLWLNEISCIDGMSAVIRSHIIFYCATWSLGLLLTSSEIINTTCATSCGMICHNLLQQSSGAWIITFSQHVLKPIWINQRGS